MGFTANTHRLICFRNKKEARSKLGKRDEIGSFNFALHSTASSLIIQKIWPSSGVSAVPLSNGSVYDEIEVKAACLLPLKQKGKKKDTVHFPLILLQINLYFFLDKKTYYCSNVGWIKTVSFRFELVYLF